MRAAAQQVASFWYTAWVDGGKPDMDKLMFQALTKAEKKQLKQEKKAFQKGQLFEKDMVVAAKGKTKE